MKLRICPECSETFANPQSLWNYKQRCRGQSSVSSNGTTVQPVPKKRLFHDTTSDNSIKNPRIRALTNEIINDTSTEKPN